MARFSGCAKSIYCNTDILYSALSYSPLLIHQVMVWIYIYMYIYFYIFFLQIRQLTAHSVVCLKHFCETDVRRAVMETWSTFLIGGNLCHNLWTWWPVSFVTMSERVGDKKNKSLIQCWKGHVNTLPSVEAMEKNSTEFATTASYLCIEASWKLS